MMRGRAARGCQMGLYHGSVGIFRCSCMRSAVAVADCVDDAFVNRKRARGNTCRARGRNVSHQTDSAHHPFSTSAHVPALKGTFSYLILRWEEYLLFLHMLLKRLVVRCLCLAPATFWKPQDSSKCLSTVGRHCDDSDRRNPG